MNSEPLWKNRECRAILPHKAGRLVNQVKRLTELVSHLPRVKRSSDPADDDLLALAEAARPLIASRVTRAGPASISTRMRAS